MTRAGGVGGLSFDDGGGVWILDGGVGLIIDGDGRLLVDIGNATQDQIRDAIPIMVRMRDELARLSAADRPASPQSSGLEFLRAMKAGRSWKEAADALNLQLAALVTLAARATDPAEGLDLYLKAALLLAPLVSRKTESPFDLDEGRRAQFTGADPIGKTKLILNEAIRRVRGGEEPFPGSGLATAERVRRLLRSTSRGGAAKTRRGYAKGST